MCIECKHKKSNNSLSLFEWVTTANNIQINIDVSGQSESIMPLWLHSHKYSEWCWKGKKKITAGKTIWTLEIIETFYHNITLLNVSHRRGLEIYEQLLGRGHKPWRDDAVWNIRNKISCKIKHIIHASEGTRI